MSKLAPHPFSIVFSALMAHAGYSDDMRMGGKDSDKACDAPCCRFVQLMGPERPPSGDVRPGRGAKRKRAARHYTKRVA